MCVTLSIVPVVSQGLCFAQVTTYYYLGGFIRSPHPGITPATTLGVAWRPHLYPFHEERVKER